MEELSVNIEIGNNFLTPNVIGNQGLSPVEAIAELLANSWDWRVTKKYPEQTTSVLIQLGYDSIEVIDNGVGMTRDELNVGINLAESSDQVRQKLDELKRMGRFGMGMKVASLSLGWKFTITTISDSDPTKENVFEFNARNLEDPKSKYLGELKIITKDKTLDSPLKEFNSGTSIKIEDLVQDLPSGAALAVGMQERFSPVINFLRSTDRLDFKIINEDDHVIPVGTTEIKHAFEDEILKLDFENPGKWAKKKEYKYIGHDGKEYQLRGFIQLLKQRSEKERKYGLDLWCNDQLIEGFHKEDKKDGKTIGLFSIAGRTGEKTYGVLHLDGCKPDTVKSKGFIPDESFLAVRELIKEDLELYKYLSVASSKAKQRIKDEINKRRGLGSESPSSPSFDENESNPDDSSEEAKNPLDDKPEGTIMITDKLFVQIKNSWVFESGLSAKKNTSWEAFPRKSKTHSDLIELQVYINPNSNVFKSIQENYQKHGEQNLIMNFFKKMAVSECVFDLCIREWGYSPEAAREITDDKVYPQVLKLKLN